MLYSPKTSDYLKILADDKVRDFVVKNLGKYFKSTKKGLYSKLRGEQNLKKVAALVYIFHIALKSRKICYDFD